MIFKASDEPSDRTLSIRPRQQMVAADGGCMDGSLDGSRTDHWTDYTSRLFPLGAMFGRLDAL